ncbi:type VI secretion system baseplate subunit TssG [Rhizobium sp. NLR9b]|uniref:type VI secretion system baseplate subunit TssG n=1 Tax=unclassified Rhizobium TaxID=2613769 RepID=UPI001C836379|nr:MULTISPECIES: type VI secretion system baseplate subunit TssG [unclassified Rhizobium]MBX5230610.1 type VI secretion system baseplate subunit TssG [Rhizobium sp. NLR9b]MBX5291278.1 type VI secretion system baseplate subunit TssG [Rhizobium sp. NLR10b]
MANNAWPADSAVMQSKLDRLLSAVAAKPHAYDFFQVMRLIDAICSDRPRIGESSQPGLDRVRLGQQPTLAFPTRSIAHVNEARENLPARISTYAFGLFGPNGPLPLHLTEFALFRQRNAADETFVRFTDIFHHRLASLFFRAWAESEPSVSHDRPQTDRFALQLGALAGFGMTSLHERDAMPDLAKLHFIGRLASLASNAEGLAAILAGFFKAPVEILEFIPKWIELPLSALCLLGRDPCTGTLGSTATAGARIKVYHHRFRIVIGPVSLAQYERLLPGACDLETFTAIIRNYLGDELDWEVTLVLTQNEVPKVLLGHTGRLGWTSWMGERCPPRDAADLTMMPGERPPTGAVSNFPK